MKHTSQITILIATLAAVANTSSAATIAEWNFNVSTNLATRLQSSGVASGLTVSSLAINPSHDFAGVNAVPNTVNDGYGFGGNSGEQVMFIHRANYFNSSASPSPRPEGRVTTWGNPGTDPANTIVGNSPLSFTVTADSLTTLTLNSVNIAAVGFTGGYLLHFQEAGASGGVSSIASTTSSTAFLTNPIVIGAGQSKTFTIKLNSGTLNSAHNFNTITLDGTVTAVPEPSVVAWLPALLGAALLRRRRSQRNQI